MKFSKLQGGRIIQLDNPGNPRKMMVHNWTLPPTLWESPTQAFGRPDMDPNGDSSQSLFQVNKSSRTLSSPHDRDLNPILKAKIWYAKKIEKNCWSFRHHIRNAMFWTHVCWKIQHFFGDLKKLQCSQLDHRCVWGVGRPPNIHVEIWLSQLDATNSLHDKWLFHCLYVPWSKVAFFWGWETSHLY